MSDVIDQLEVQIEANTQGADTAIDDLCNKLGRLTTAVKQLESGNIGRLANAMGNFNISLKKVASVNASGLESAANSLDKLSKINTANFTSLSNSVSALKTGLENIGNINFSPDGLESIANSIRAFGYKTSTAGTANLSKLKTDLVEFANGLNSVGNINFNFDSLQNAISNISKLGGKSVTQATANLPLIKDYLLDFLNGLSNVESYDVSSITLLTSDLSKLGGKSVTAAIANLPLLSTALNDLLVTLSGAPTISQNVIQMTNALANLASRGSKVGSASSSIVKGLNKASTSAVKANKSFKGLAYMFGKFYANCFLVIRGVKALWNSINSTADYLEAFNYFEVALNKVGGDWASDWEKYSEKLGVTSAEEYANSFKTRLNESLSGLSGVQISIDANGETGLLTDTGMKNLGLNIQEVTQYASQLASVTNSVGQTGEVTLAAASAFTKLGADMSSLFNLNYSDVMTNLQSGLIGQSRALYKYGIDITNATLQTYAYKLGVEKAVSEMTQAEKMQLRMIAILDQSRVAWGDQANTINSLSNSIRQFKNNLSEAGQILGQLFVPVLSKVMPIVNGLTIAIKRLMVSIANIMGIELDLSEFGQGTSDITDELDGLTDGLDEVAESADKAKAGLRGFDKLNVISTSSDSGTDTAGISSGLDLTEQILAATSEYEAAWQEAYDKMVNKAEEFADKIEKALEPIKGIFEDIKVGDWFALGEDTSNLVSDIFDFFSSAIEKVDWKGIGNGIGEYLAGIDWLDVLSSIGNLIWDAINAGIELWKGSFEAAPIETGIISAVALLKFTGIGGLIWSKISAEIAKSTSFTAIGTTLLAGLKSLFGSEAATSALAFISPITKAVAGIGSIISGATIAVSNFFSMWENGFDWLSEALEIIGIGLAAVGAVILGAPAAITAVIAAITAAVATVAIVIHDNWGTISEFLANAWNTIKEKASGIADWFNEKVIQPVVNFFKPIGETISSVFEGAWIVVQAVWILASDWFDAVTEPIRKTFTALGEIIGEKLVNAWNTIKGVWGFASSWMYNAVIKPVQKVFETLWGGLKTGAVSALNGIIGAIEGMLNFVIGAINNLLNGFNKVVNWAEGVVGANWGGITLLQEVSLKKVNIDSYEIGGFPKKYSMFMAGEDGKTEMLGTVGGKTAVAGSAEITGISETIRSTSKEEITLLKQQNALLQAILEKEFGISQSDIGKAAQNYARDYTRRTGREAYSF